MNKFKIWQYIGILALILLSLFPALAFSQQHAPTGDTSTLSVAGTTWTGTNPDSNYGLHFQADGTLNYMSVRGDSVNGTWKQNGNGIYM